MKDEDKVPNVILVIIKIIFITLLALTVGVNIEFFIFKNITFRVFAFNLLAIVFLLCYIDYRKDKNK